MNDMSGKPDAKAAAASDQQPTFRRFKDGENMWTGWNDLTEKIFQQDHSYKCPTYVHRTPPCQGSCPSGHEIRGWLAIARQMDKPPVKDMKWQEYAFNRMVDANPFPATMGRVCPAPCEDGCNRNEVDDFVGINGVEQYVGDWANENGLKLPGSDAPYTGKLVAVIGGGPAGLSAAYFLRRKGHGVAIFDEHEELGGMMRYGIPGYRTPREMLDKEIGRIVALGVEVRANTRVGRDISVEELEKSFDAIFWACGAQKGRPLPVPGWEGTDNCITGVEFLDAFNKGWVVGTAKRVVVVGGGDTSIDVASVARRLGHITVPANKDIDPHNLLGYTAHDVAGTMRREGMQATLTSLFPIEKMTASERERADAAREGVTIMGGVMPLEVLKDEKGLARALRMCKCTMKDGKPIPEAGTEFELPCDIIISAIGQMGDFNGLAGLDNGKGFANTDQMYRVKGRPKHFAGGDLVRPHLLTTAIGHGRIVSEVMDHFLAGAPVDKRPKVDVHHFNLLNELHQRALDPTPYDNTQTRGTSSAGFAVHNYEDRSASQIIPHDELFKGHFKYEARGKRSEIHIEADKVLGNFEERIKGFTEQQAINEGKRCMSCGMCFECDNCVVFCPQTAVKRVPKKEKAVGRYVYTDYSMCIGCHICADVCPSGYIQMGLGE
jgi:NADPH-dependent glutamate synthase beta subunit-like oxidoreductase